MIESAAHLLDHGPNAGRQALTLRTVPAQPQPVASTLLARQPSFSLHAATCCEANQRDKLEKLCRYIARPAIANERLSTNERGQIVYKFKQPFRNGTTHVVLEPLELMAHTHVRHPTGDLRSSKSAILPICHRPSRRPGPSPKTQPHALPWGVRPELQASRVGRAKTQTRRGESRQTARSHVLDAALAAGLRHRYQDLPQMRRQAQGDRLHRGSRRDRYHP